MRRFLRLGIQRALSSSSYPSSSPSLSIWRGKRKEMGKEGPMVVQEMKRLQNSPPERLQSFIKSRVSRLLKSDLLAVLAEFQRQDNVCLCLMVFFALTMTAIGVSQTSASAPDSSKGKAAAVSIFSILDRKSRIDPSKEVGVPASTRKGKIMRPPQQGMKGI